MVISPLCLSTMMRREMSRPRPVPTPTSLVVKNGSKARACRCSGIPGPVSAISTTTHPRSSTLVVSRRVPVRPMASRALAMRFVQTWLSSPGMASMRGSSGSKSRTTVMSRRSLCPNITRVLSRPSVTLIVCIEARSSWEYSRTAATRSEMRWVASFTSASNDVIDSELATHSRAAPSGPSPMTDATCSHHATSIPAAASAGAISQGSSTPCAVSQSDRISSLSDRVSASSVDGLGPT